MTHPATNASGQALYHVYTRILCTECANKEGNIEYVTQHEVNWERDCCFQCDDCGKEIPTEPQPDPPHINGPVECWTGGKCDAR